MNQPNPSLAEWQQAMIDYAQHKRLGDVHARRAPDEKFTELFQSTSNLSKRLEAYKNNYLVALIQWLEKTYPMVQQVVGPEYFKLLAKSFIKNHPLTDERINHYGKEFVSHLEQLKSQRPELEELPFLVDLAATDWYLHQAYYVADRTIFDVNAFSSLPHTDQLKAQFSLAHDIFVIESTWPIAALWSMHYQQQPLDSIVETDHPRYFLVQRAEAKPTVETVTSNLFELFNQIREGSNLEALSVNFSDLIPHAIAQGWITGFRIN